MIFQLLEMGSSYGNFVAETICCDLQYQRIRHLKMTKLSFDKVLLKQ